MKGRRKTTQDYLSHLEEKKVQITNSIEKQERLLQGLSVSDHNWLDEYQILNNLKLKLKTCNSRLRYYNSKPRIMPLEINIHKLQTR